MTTMQTLLPKSNFHKIDQGFFIFQERVTDSRWKVVFYLLHPEWLMSEILITYRSSPIDDFQSYAEKNKERSNTKTALAFAMYEYQGARGYMRRQVRNNCMSEETRIKIFKNMQRLYAEDESSKSVRIKRQAHYLRAATDFYLSEGIVYQ